MFCLFYRIYGHFVFRSPQPPPWGRTTGAVRPEDYPHREGCVRDKWEAQKPTTALASGFGYLLPPKGTKPPRHTPRLRLLCRPKSGKQHQSKTAISTFCDPTASGNPRDRGGARASVSAKSVAIFRSGTRFATFGLVVPGKIVTFESYLFKPIERCSNACSRLRPSSIKRG